VAQLLVDEHTQVIAVGPNDTDVTTACRKRLAETVAAGNIRVVVDLSEVAHIDNSMVSVLMGGQRMLQVREGQLMVVHPAPAPLTALKMAGLTEQLDIAPTRERALAKLQKHKGADRSASPTPRLRRHLARTW
jgi:anti-anti-sigma factor